MIIHSNRKQLRIDDELIQICKEIVEHNKVDSEWSEIESSDFFQTEKYCGGYEAIEQCFCFSYYEEEIEYWFDFALAQVPDIVNNKLKYLDLRLADN